jgi:hypothetical protein
MSLQMFPFRLTLWAAYLFAEQQTVTLLMVIKSSYTAAITSIYITIIYLVLGSATVRFVSLSQLHCLSYEGRLAVRASGWGL